MDLLNLFQFICMLAAAMFADSTSDAWAAIAASFGVLSQFTNFNKEPLNLLC